MSKILAILLLGIAAALPASAQEVSSLARGMSPDDVAAMLPPICPAAPASDTLNGTTGTGAPCTARPDSTRPTAVQSANTTLAADCTWSVTFARAFTSTTPIVHASIVLSPGATLPIPCFPTSRSTTAASGKCFPAQTATLNLSIITAGLNLSPFGATCTAGMAVMVVGREPTQ